jgi:hypothetical protein
MKACNGFLLIVLTALLSVLPSCGGDDDDPVGGTLVFTANGEDFVRSGFISKDNWSLTFDHVYAVIGGPTAFQVAEAGGGGSGKFDPSRHAGHPHVGLTGGGAHVALAGTYVVDLAQGSGPTALGTVSGVAVGNYNRVAWDLKLCDGPNAIPVPPVTSAELEVVHGCSLVLVGTAVDNATSAQKDFVIRFRESIYWVSTGAHQSDIGVVAEGGSGTAEMTFHLDHIFGDYSELPTEGVNPGAVGFTPFAALDQDADDDLYADEGVMEEFMPASTYRKLYRAFVTLGHTGEAHCMFMPGGSGSGGEEASDPEPEYMPGETGTLEFIVDGEDFARSGFTSKDGWAVSFTHVYVCVKDPTAYRLPKDAMDTGGEEALTGGFLVDLAQGTQGTKIGECTNAPVGHYARVSWELKDIEAADTPVSPVTAVDRDNLIAGGTACLILVGSGTKSATTVDFTLRIHDPMAYMAAGPHPDNEGRITTQGGTGRAFMTFHLDHIFGDFDTIDEWDSVNPGAVGFGPLAALDNTAGDADLTVGTIDVDMPGLGGMSAADLLTFYKAWLTLGHCGETHAFAAVGEE